jgi:ATPase subunit of ABC transporter with duplicated ATPase domains
MNKTVPITKSGQPLLELSNINTLSPEGRLLFHDLNLVLGYDKVAVIGRNGVGKSTLLNIINGNEQPDSGSVRCKNKPYLVNQQVSLKSGLYIQNLSSLLPEKILTQELDSAGLAWLYAQKHSTILSYGEARKLQLLVAKLSCSDLLLLDEPTEDLDEAGVKWLIKWLLRWKNGLLVVSHDLILLNHFKHFFVITESGCKYFSGRFSDLNKKMKEEEEKAEKKYLQKLHILSKKEEQRIKILRRRQRKKNFGRISELKRCTPKQRLNKKRGKAQVNQGKAAKISMDRISNTRDWVSYGRKALTVNLPLELHLPKSLATGEKKFAPHGHELQRNGQMAQFGFIRLEKVSAKSYKRVLFKNINLSLGHERLAITGPNGAGKTTLLNIITGKSIPLRGKVKIFSEQVYSIEQGGTNWLTKESLWALLKFHSRLKTMDEIAHLLLIHKFPIALANRPLKSLSPGERVRAVLIYLFQQASGVEILVLDEPTYSLDFTGKKSLSTALKAWPGALITVSNNREFLTSINISKKLELDGNGGHHLLAVRVTSSDSSLSENPVPVAVRTK